MCEDAVKGSVKSVRLYGKKKNVAMPKRKGVAEEVLNVESCGRGCCDEDDPLDGGLDPPLRMPEPLIDSSVHLRCSYR